MAIDILIKNGRIVSSQGIFKASIAIDNGLVQAVGELSTLPEANHLIDADDNIILPGVIDGHAYTRLPSEDPVSGTKAAARGGITTMMEMPETQKGCFNPSEFIEKRDRYERSSYFDFCIHVGCASCYPEGTLTEMWRMGATGRARPDTSRKLSATSKGKQKGLFRLSLMETPHI